MFSAILRYFKTCIAQIHNFLLHPFHFVAEYYGITTEDLDSSKRSRNISYPRHIAVFLIRKEIGLSYPAIGKLFGGKDHTSMMHSVEVIEEEIKYSKELKLAFNGIMEIANR